MVGNMHVQKALKNIDNPDFTIRKRAIQTLARARYEPAVPRLTKMFYDDTQHERVRAIIARALGRIGTQDCFHALVIVLSQIDPATLKRQHVVSHDRSETYQLQNTMLSVAITVGLQMIGTKEARKILDAWRSGELYIKHTAKS